MASGGRSAAESGVRHLSDIDWFKEVTKAQPVARPRGPQSQPDIDWFAEVSGPPTPTQPTSSIQRFPETTPVSRETEGAADISTVAAASLARDVADQISYYSRELGIPAERFGLREGQIVYQTDEGTLQAVAPGFARQFAQGLGPSIPAAGGMVGAAVGAVPGAGVGSLATGAIGGALGAAGAEAARQNLANYLGVQEAGLEDVSRAAVTEGAYDIGAGLAGTLVAKGVSRAVATRAAKELNRMIREEGREAMDALRDTLAKVNRDYNVDVRLTPAELTNLPKLQGQQLALTAGPETAQTMMPFYGRRAGELQQTVPRFLSRQISPTAPGADVAGQRLGQSSEAALRNIQRQRSIRGRPAYQAAFAAGPVDISPAIKQLDELTTKASRPLRAALGKVRREMVDEAGAPITDLETVQNAVKELLDDEISSAARAGRNKQARALREVQGTLLETLDEQNPLYAEARKLWGDLSGPVTTAQGGILPGLAKAKPETYAAMGERLFGRASPAEIQRAKAAILKTPKGKQNWNAALRGFLEDRWSQAGREFKSTVGRRELGEAAQPVSFWANVYGDPKQQARLKAAMDPKQFTAFRNLMQVMEATGRAINWNSTTPTQIEGLQSVRTPARVAQTMKMLSTQPLQPIAEAYEQWIQGVNLQRLADVITTSDSIEELAKVTSAKAPRMRTFQAVARALNLARANVQAAQERE